MQTVLVGCLIGSVSMMVIGTVLGKRRPKSLNDAVFYGCVTADLQCYGFMIFFFSLLFLFVE